MTTRIGETEAVLKAADEWVAAQETLVAVQRIGNQSVAEEEAADIAGFRLVLAVTRWRGKRGAG